MKTLKNLFASYGRKLEGMFNRQMRVFCCFINARIKEYDYQIKDIKELSSGVGFYYLMRSMVSEDVDLSPLQGMNFKSDNAIIKMNNCNILVTFLRDDQGMKLHGINATQIAQGNEKTILGLLWSLISKYQVHCSSEKPVGKNYFRMMRWVNSKVPEEHHVDTIDKWSSGQTLYHLINAILQKWDVTEKFVLPGAESMEPLELVEKCIDFSYERFEVPKIIEADDMVVDPDELTILTYVSYFKNLYRTHLKKKKEEKKKKKEKKEEKKRSKKMLFKSMKKKDVAAAKAQFAQEPVPDRPPPRKKAEKAEGGEDEDEAEDLFNFDEEKKKDEPQPEPEIYLEPPTPDFMATDFDEGEDEEEEEVEGEKEKKKKKKKKPKKKKMIFTLSKREFKTFKSGMEKKREAAKKEVEEEQKQLQEKNVVVDDEEKKKKKEQEEEEAEAYHGVFMGEELPIFVKDDKVQVGYQDDPELIIPFETITMISQEQKKHHAKKKGKKPVVIKIQQDFGKSHYFEFYDKVGESFEIAMMKKLSLGGDDLQEGEFVSWYRGKERMVLLQKPGFAIAAGGATDAGEKILQIKYGDITLFESYEYRDKKVYKIQKNWKITYDLTFYERTEEFEEMLLKFLHSAQ